MDKFTFKNWLHAKELDESAYTAATLALASVGAQDMKGQAALNRPAVYKHIVQENKLRAAQQLLKHVQTELPQKMQLLLNNLANKLVHPLDPFATLHSQTKLAKIHNMNDLEQRLHALQTMVNSVELQSLAKMDPEKLAYVVGVLERIHNAIGIYDAKETDDEKARQKDLDTIKRLDFFSAIDMELLPKVLGRK